MVEKIKKEVSKKNYYKISTFALVGLIILVLLGFGGVQILKDSYNNGVIFGQQNAVNILLGEVNEKGFVEVGLGNNRSLVLVPSSMIEQGQKELVSGIFNSLNEKGYVQINAGENNSVVLVPYVEPSQE